jgi:hypothetical protein
MLCYACHARFARACGGGGNLLLRTSWPAACLPAGSPLLAPMLAGAWIGKPTAGNPRKLRYFQLSHDGSTLRWSWNK